MKTLAEPHQPLQFTAWNLLEPAAMLVLTKFLLLVVPFGWVYAGLGLTSRQADLRQLSRRAARSTQRTRHLLSYIGVTYPALGACVPQGVAAALMLRLRGIRSTLHFGVLKTASPEQPLRAHAWLTAGGFVVTGDGTRVAFDELSPQSAKASSPHLTIPQGEGSL